MRKIIIIIGIILGFLLINIFSINSYYNNFKGEESYENKNFSGALNIFKNEKNYVGLYNLGNTNYRLGEQEKEDNRKIEYWEKSVDFYKNSLKLKYDPRTEYNYNFVLDKLKKLKKKQKEEKKEQEQKNNKDQKSGEEKNQDKKENGDNKKDGNSKDGKEGENSEKSDKKDGEQSKKNGENGEKGDSKQSDSQEGNSQNSGDNKGKSEPQLSKQAKQQIKAYEEKLKQDQKENAGNFGKVYSEQINPFDSFDSFFGNDPFFDNSLLDNGGDKKDW